MGLFSSSTKYYAFASSSTLLPEEEREHTVKSLMLQSIISGQSTLSDAIKMGLQTDLYRRAISMARYAAKEGGYPYGFPSVNNTRYIVTPEIVQPYIEADAGGPIIIRNMTWNSWEEPNTPDFFTEARISETYLDLDYFPWDPVLGFPDDTNWNHQDAEVEIPVVDPGPPEAYELADNNYNVTVTGNSFQVSFNYDGGTWNVAQPYDMTPYNQGDSVWIKVRYRMEGSGNQFLYWYYLIDSNEIPELEAAIESEQFFAEYLPIAVLMHDLVWFDEQDDPVLEKGLDRLLKDIAMDPFDVKADFLDSIENPDPETPPDQIPEIEDIWDFFIQFGMPLKTTTRGGREYLFRFYQYLATRTWTTFDDYNNWVLSGIGEQPSSNFSVEEGEEYTGYIARYAWSYITEVTNTGEFTPLGWTEPLRKRRLWSDTFKLGDSDYNYGLDLVHGEGNYNVATSQGEEQEHTYTMVVRRNEDDTHTIVLMMGPSMEYQINTSEVTLGQGAGGYEDFRYRFVDVELFPEDPEEDSEFRWPIRIGSLKEVSAMQREPALQEALAATVFLVESVKVKWYQKGFFKWLIIIIVIIIIVLAQQYELLGTVASMASSTAAAGATGTAIAYAALYVVMSFALGFLISFAGSLIGGKFGQAFVILASMYLAGGANMFSQVGRSWNAFTQAQGWGNAARLLNSVQPYIKMGRLIIEQRALADLESELRDFNKTAREKYEELQDAWDELGTTPSWLDPLDLVASFQASWYIEQPDNYYQRTLNANPGLLGYDLVNRFAELALTLPEQGNEIDLVTAMFHDMERQRGAV